MTRLRAWLQAAHPFPIVAVLSLTTLIGLVSTDGRPDLTQFALMLVAMLTSQLAIGWSNDYVDRAMDAVHQPSKPVPSGLVGAQALLIASMVALGVSVACGVALGVVPLVLLVMGTVAGLAYNAGVKDTRLSWLPYVCAFAVLPPFVWSALDAFRDAYAWLYAIGAPLAVAAHLANVLPDVETDAVANRPGLAVVLGRSRALMLLGALMVLPVAVIAVSALWLRYDAGLLTAVVTGYLVMCGVAAAAYRRRPFRDGAVRGFRCVALASVLLVAGWLAAVR